ncbi:hypothetical protein GPECTOR_26g545 [Gonium pectorale]|uniref:Uncharacterized protein n=1 Tax=Gonium pectorale TaxID=33097 RepID=A0A150GFM5_GONPE|nr:hypothetical protein GPECTOR_26g545 [Gonium pectorale]|eukprot:KXZ48642.1 hypothetical protein GPECTOR_26g545 [Gonium pectorale]
MRKAIRDISYFDGCKLNGIRYKKPGGGALTRYDLLNDQAVQGWYDSGADLTVCVFMEKEDVSSTRAKVRARAKPAIGDEGEKKSWAEKKLLTGNFEKWAATDGQAEGINVMDMPPKVHKMCEDNEGSVKDEDERPKLKMVKA